MYLVTLLPLIIMVLKRKNLHFTQKPSLRINYDEILFGEGIDEKNQKRITNFICPIKNSDAVCKFYADMDLNQPSIKWNTTHVDFKDKNLDNVWFFRVKSLPAVKEHLTPKF